MKTVIFFKACSEHLKNDSRFASEKGGITSFFYKEYHEPFEACHEKAEAFI